jgi:O-antigen/teichoic acid export membrane protein
MGTTNQFVKNTIVLISAKILQPLMAFVLVVTISRKIGVEGFGAYSTIFKYLPIFQVVAAFGLRDLVAREVAQNKKNSGKYLLAASYIALVCSLLSAILMGGIVNILSSDRVVILGALLASVSLIIAGLSDIYEGFLNGYEKIRYVGYATIAQNFFRVGLSVWLIYNGFGVIAVVLVFVIGRFLRTIYFYSHINRNIVKALGKTDRKSLKDLFHQSKTFALIMVCVTIYWNIDGIMLESMRSAEDVGYYSAAYRFLALSMVLVYSYVTSLFPVISSLFKTAKDRFDFACKVSLRLLLLASIPIAVTFSFLAEKIILLVFGEEFLPSTQVLQILIWALIPYAISQIFAYALVASNNQKIDLRVNAAGMFSNILLNFILIPQYGYTGAAIATLISIHIYVALQIPPVLKKLLSVDYKIILGHGIRMVVAALLMATSIYVLVLQNVNLFAILPVAFLIYGICVLGLGLITKSDRQMLFRIVRIT